MSYSSILLKSNDNFSKATIKPIYRSFCINTAQRLILKRLKYNLTLYKRLKSITLKQEMYFIYSDFQYIHPNIFYIEKEETACAVLKLIFI